MNLIKYHSYDRGHLGIILVITMHIWISHTHLVAVINNK